jgi:hypothetical protein
MKIVKDLESRQRQNSSTDASIALIYVGLGDNDQSTIWLNQGVSSAIQSFHPHATGLRSAQD